MTTPRMPIVSEKAMRGDLKNGSGVTMTKKLIAKITAERKVAADSAGKGVAVTISSSTPTSILGTAVTTTTGADQDVEVELSPQGVSFTGIGGVADATALAAISAGNRFDKQLMLKE